MAKKKNWYAVWGTNGLGIYRTWKRAKTALQYLEKANVEGFKIYSDAKRKALMDFNYYNDDDFEGPIPIDFTISREHIEIIRELELASDAKIKVVFKDKKPTFEEV